jgi:methionine biosynthesis protein MetW
MTDTAEFNPSYVGLRRDILRVLPDSPGRVLDVGCATGELGAYLRNERGAEAWGIETDPAMADVARPRLNGVWVADLNADSLADLAGEKRFDVIVFGDILEHLIDPWRVLREGAALLRPDGCIITSIPNVGHVSTLWSLAVRGRWPYRERGIHDRTHLRFFTRRNLLELFEQAGLSVEIERRNVRLCEAGDRWWSFLDPLLDLWPWRRLFVFQYLYMLRRG